MPWWQLLELPLKFVKKRHCEYTKQSLLFRQIASCTRNDGKFNSKYFRHFKYYICTVKIKNNKLLYLILIMLVSQFALAQVKIRDSVVHAILINASYHYNQPLADLKNRFGDNMAVSLEGYYKTTKNYFLGVSGSFLFGSTIKEEIMENLKTSSGQIISEDGFYADVVLMQRGFTANLHIGKLIPVLSPNPNSGFLFMTGLSFLQHKIRIENQYDDVPYLSEDYKKGYDRLSNGIGYNAFVGYVFLDNRKLINFFGGFEFTHAFTKNRRSYNYDTMTKDNSLRNDIFYGLKIGWILPFYDRVPNDYYFD